MKSSICLNCGFGFMYKPQVKTGKYCSNDCFNSHRVETKYIAWINGEVGVWKDSKALKRAVIRRDGYFCSECKITEWNNKPIVLELEHKNGDSYNNKPENLCLICPNCHSQTSTFKSKNRGNGRHKRMQRRKEGKSY